jgi:RND family efflux transporter MFP subunit
LQPHDSDPTTERAAEASSPGPARAAQPPPKNVGWKLTTLAVLLAIGLAVGFFIVQHHKAQEAAALDADAVTQADAAPSVDVVTVNYAPPSETVGYPGETRGWYQSTIYARINGYVGQWLVDIGDRVQKGQVLATIDTPDLDAQFQAAEHQLAMSQAQVDVVKANAEFAKTTYDRWKDSPKGVVSEQERDEKKAEYESSLAQMTSAQAKVSADQANVAQLSALESYKKVTAPFDGVITSRHIDIGDLVTAGSTSSTSSLYTMAQINEIRVFVDVPQKATAGMEIGVPATATAIQFPDKKFQGKITRTSNAIDPVTRTLQVEVDLDNPNLILMPGMYVEVNFVMSHESLLRVPASALMFRSGGPQVAVVGSDGKIAFRDVRIAIDNGDYVEIGSGLSANEKVALNLSNQIAEGQTVVPTDIDSSEKTAQAPANKSPAVTAATPAPE